MSDDLSPGTLPAVPCAERDRLPRISAVHFALSETREVLYIRRTRNLRQRWAVHHRLPQLTQCGCMSIAWYVAAQETLETMESTMIQEFQPPPNRSWSPLRAQQKPRGIHRLACRLPEDLYQAIQETAKTDTRPINSQVIVLLREALRTWKPKSVDLAAHGSLTP